MSRLLTLTSLFAAGACLAAPAFAQTAATPPAAAAAATPATPAVAAPSPTAPVAATAAVPAAPAVAKTAAKDKIICEEEEVIGSRLGGHRVCKTASAWAEERRAARDEVERSQTNRGVGGPNG